MRTGQCWQGFNKRTSRPRLDTQTVLKQPPWPIQDRQISQERLSWLTRNRQRRWEWEAEWEHQSRVEHKCSFINQNVINNSLLGDVTGSVQGDETGRVVEDSSSNNIRGAEFSTSTSAVVEGTGLNSIP